jgi:hypothetical protein
MSYIILPFTVMNNSTLWPWNLSQLGSLSPLSSESHATRAFDSSRPQAATHSLSSVVLPKPAGADDEADASHRGEFAVQTRGQPFDQAWARHQPWPDGGDIEFGFQEGDGHSALPSGVSWPTSPVNQAPRPSLSYHILSIHTTLVKGRTWGYSQSCQPHTWQPCHFKQNTLAPVSSSPATFLDCPGSGSGTVPQDTKDRENGFGGQNGRLGT